MFPPQNAVVVNVVVERASGGIAVGDVIVMRRDKNFYKYTDELQQYTTQVTGVCITPRTEARGGVSVCVRGLITINVENAAAYTPAAPYTINKYLVLGRVVSRIERDSVPGLPRSERHALRVFVSPELLSRYDAGRATLRWERFLMEPTLIAAREAVRTASGKAAADAAVEKAIETIASAVTQEAAHTPVRSTGDPAADLAAIASDAKQLLRGELDGLKTLNADISQKAKDSIEATINKGGDISGTSGTLGAETTIVRTVLFDKMTNANIKPDADAIRTLIEWNKVFNTMIDSTTTNNAEKAWAMYDVIRATVPTLGTSLAKWLSPNGFIAREAGSKTTPVLDDVEVTAIESAGTWTSSIFQYLTIELFPEVGTESLAPWVNGIYEFTSGSTGPEWCHVEWGHNVKLSLVDNFICLHGNTSKYTNNKARRFKFISVSNESSFTTFFKDKFRCTAFVLNGERSTLSPIIIKKQKYKSHISQQEIATAKKVPEYSERTRDYYFETIDFTRLDILNQNKARGIIECSDFLERLETYLDTIHVMGIHCCGHILEHVGEELQHLQALNTTAQCTFVLDDDHTDRLKTFLAYSTLSRDWDNPHGTSLDWLSRSDNKNPLGLTDVNTMMNFMQRAASTVTSAAKRVTIYSTDSIDYTFPLGLYDCNAEGVYRNVADPSFAFTADKDSEDYNSIDYAVMQNGKQVSTVNVDLNSSDEYKPMNSHFPMIFDKATVRSVVSSKEQTIRVEYVRGTEQYVYVSIRDPHEGRIMSTFVLDYNADQAEFFKTVKSTYKASSKESVTLFPDDENPSEIEAGMLLVYYTEQYLRVVLKDSSDGSVIGMGLRSSRSNKTAAKFAKTLGTDGTDKFPGVNVDTEATSGVHVFYNANVDIFKLKLFNTDTHTLLDEVEYNPSSTITIDTIANRELIRGGEAIFHAPGVKGTETKGDYNYFNKPVITVYGMRYQTESELDKAHNSWWLPKPQQWYYEQSEKNKRSISAPDNWDALNEQLKRDPELRDFTLLPLPKEKSAETIVLAQLKEGRLFVPIMKMAPTGTAPGSLTASLPPVSSDESLESTESSFQDPAFGSRKRVKSTTKPPKATGGGRDNRIRSTASRRSTRGGAVRGSDNNGKQ